MDGSRRFFESARGSRRRQSDDDSNSVSMIRYPRHERAAAWATAQGHSGGDSSAEETTSTTATSALTTSTTTTSSTARSTSTRKDIEEAKEDLILAIDAMSASEKEAFDEAFERAPHLIETESNLDLFLAVEDFNPKAAAERLARHWKIRKNVFGDDAFRPMDISPEGALAEDDLDMMERAGFAQLPYDNEGRPVICIDPSRLEGITVSDEEVRRHCFRVLFYNLHKIAMENPQAQTDGIVVVRRIDVSQFSLGQCQKTIQIMQNCMAIRIHKFHFCATPSASEKKYILAQIVPMLVETVGKDNSNRLVVHMGKPQSILHSLGKYGMPQEGLPAVLGGSWSYTGFTSMVQTLRDHYRSGRQQARARPQPPSSRETREQRQETRHRPPPPLERNSLKMSAKPSPEETERSENGFSDPKMDSFSITSTSTTTNGISTSAFAEANGFAAAPKRKPTTELLSEARHTKRRKRKRDGSSYSLFELRKENKRLKSLLFNKDLRTDIPGLSDEKQRELHILRLIVMFLKALVTILLSLHDLNAIVKSGKVVLIKILNLARHLRQQQAPAHVLASRMVTAFAKWKASLPPGVSLKPQAAQGVQPSQEQRAIAALEKELDREWAFWLANQRQSS